MTTASLGVFRIGQRPVITATFADITGGSGVATASTFIVRTPDGTETTKSSPNAQIVNTSSNVWTFTMSTLTTAGVHVIEARTTSGLIAANEYMLTCLASALTSP